MSRPGRTNTKPSVTEPRKCPRKGPVPRKNARFPVPVPRATRDAVPGKAAAPRSSAARTAPPSTPPRRSRPTSGSRRRPATSRFQETKSCGQRDRKEGSTARYRSQTPAACRRITAVGTLTREKRTARASGTQWIVRRRVANSRTKKAAAIRNAPFRSPRPSRRFRLVKNPPAPQSRSVRRVNPTPRSKFRGAWGNVVHGQPGSLKASRTSKKTGRRPSVAAVTSNRSPDALAAPGSIHATRWSKGTGGDLLGGTGTSAPESRPASVSSAGQGLGWAGSDASASVGT